MRKKKLTREARDAFLAEVATLPWGEQPVIALLVKAMGSVEDRSDALRAWLSELAIFYRPNQLDRFVAAIVETEARLAS